MEQHRDCPFCQRTHYAATADAVEEMVMACREAHRTETGRYQGSLEDWPEERGTFAPAGV